MKRFLSLVAGAALVLGVAGNAAASYDLGTFLGTVTDGTNETTVGLGYAYDGLTDVEVGNYFNADLSFFTNASTFSELTFGGFGGNTTEYGINYNYWIAVTDINDVALDSSAYASTMTGIQNLPTFTTGTGAIQVDNIANNGITNRNVVTDLDRFTGATSTIDLSALDNWTAGEVASVSMDIVHIADDYYGYGGFTTVEDTGANLVISRIADGSITAAIATPIPGAAWLLGSGLLALVGIRRKKA